MDKWTTIADMAKTKTVAAVIQLDTARAIERVAKKEKRTVSWTIARMLEKQTGTAMKAKTGNRKNIARKVGGRAAPR